MNSIEDVQAYLDKQPDIWLAESDFLIGRTTPSIVSYMISAGLSCATVSARGRVGSWQNRTIGDIYRVVHHYNGDSLLNVYEELHKEMGKSYNSFICSDILKRVYYLIKRKNDFADLGSRPPNTDEFGVDLSGIIEKYNVPIRETVYIVQPNLIDITK